MPGFDADDEDSRPPPHPLDRTWLHPSELGTGPRPGTAPTDRAARRSWRRDGALALGAGAVGALAAVAVLAVVGAFDDGTPDTVRSTPITTSTDAAAIAAQVAPGIVAVSATVSPGDDRRGSGVVVGPHELLTTTNVVGSESATVRIATGNGHDHSARVQATDPVTGLVLLRVNGVRMRPATLGAPSAVRAGDWVVAVGRTATSEPWVTSGVVTGTGGWQHDADGVAHPNLIATNTTVDDDARGGALVDGKGHVVGILATGAAAVPAEMADDVATQLSENGAATHGALGIRAGDTPAGPTIAEISDGSSASRAGLRVDDRIVAVDGTVTKDSAALVYELRRRRAGTRAVLTIRRGGKTTQITATLDDAASTMAAPIPAGMTPLAISTDGS